MAIEVNTKNFEKEVVNADKPVVIDFWAGWCGPCKMMKPVFEELSQEYTDVKFVKVDVDQEKQIASEFGVRSIPTLSFIKDGKEVDRAMGFMQKTALKEKVDKILG